MFLLWKPKVLGALGALMFGGQAVQGIELDLSDTSKIWPYLGCIFCTQIADLIQFL